MTDRNYWAWLGTAAAMAAGSGLLWALAAVAGAPKAGPEAAAPALSAEAGAAPAEAPPPLDGIAWQVSASFTAEEGPAIAATETGASCALGQPVLRSAFQKAGQGLSSSHTWTVCLRHGARPVEAPSDWSAVDPAVGLAAEGRMLTFVAAGQGDRPPWAAAVVGYCEDDGWCTAGGVAASTKAPSTLAVALRGRGTRVAYFQQGSAPISEEPSREAWYELTPDR